MRFQILAVVVSSVKVFCLLLEQILNTLNTLILSLCWKKRKKALETCAHLRHDSQEDPYVIFVIGLLLLANQIKAN